MTALNTSIATSKSRSQARVSAGGTRVLRSRTSTSGVSKDHSDEETLEVPSSPGKGVDVPHVHDDGVYTTPPSSKDPKDPIAPPHNTPTSSERRKRALSIQIEDDIEWSPTPPSKKRMGANDNGQIQVHEIGEKLHNKVSPTGTLCSKALSEELEALENAAGDKVANDSAETLHTVDPNDTSCQPVAHSLQLSVSGLSDDKTLGVDNIPNFDQDGIDSYSPGEMAKVNSQSDMHAAFPGMKHTPVNTKTLSPHVFLSARNVGMWSKVIREELSGSVVYNVTYIPSSDPWTSDSEMELLMDPELVKRDLYRDLPALPLLQLIIQSAPPNNDVMEVDHDGNPVRHAMSVESWVAFGLHIDNALRYLTFSRSGCNGNPARVSPLSYSARSYGNDTKYKSFKEPEEKHQFFAVNRVTKQPAIFWMLGAVTSSYITQPCVEVGRPVYRGIHAVPQRWEKERIGSFFAMVFRNTQLIANMDGNSAFIFHTRYQSKANAHMHSSRPTTLDTFSSGTSGLRVGRFTIPTYRSPVKEATPPPYFNHGYAYSANIPVFDARNTTFELNYNTLDNLFTKLPPFEEEIHEGSCAFIGFGAGTNYYDGKWKISFFIRYIIILSTPEV